MSIPRHLKHVPLFVVEDGYEDMDGPYNPETTDIRGLSLGLAQWNDNDEEKEKYLSLKTWRWTGDKWSRMSEEIPPHRAIDLVRLLTWVLLQTEEGRKVDSSLLPRQIERDDNPNMITALEILDKRCDSEKMNGDSLLERLDELYWMIGELLGKK